jgi:CBS domain-containing protein
MLCPGCGFENIDGTDRCENCLSPFRDLDVPRPDSAEGLARSVMEDTLDQLDYDEPLFVTPETPAIEVAGRMREAHLGCALVLDGGKLVGIFTEHDVLLKMTSVTADSQTAGRPAPGAAARGSYSDEYAEEPESAIPLDGIPIQDVPFNDIPIEEIRVDELLVAETRRPVRDGQPGLIGDSRVPVKELMSPNPETLHEHESVAFALNKMSLGRYRHLPIKRADSSYAVASIKAVLKYIAREDW